MVTIVCLCLFEQNFLDKQKEMQRIVKLYLRMCNYDLWKSLLLRVWILMEEDIFHQYRQSSQSTTLIDVLTAIVDPIEFANTNGTQQLNAAMTKSTTMQLVKLETKQRKGGKTLLAWVESQKWVWMMMKFEKVIVAMFNVVAILAASCVRAL